MIREENIITNCEITNYGTMIIKNYHNRVINPMILK